MYAPTCARLTNLPLRDAWKDEARDFTPWLAENFEALSEAVGMELELTGTEVAVESFSADILARDALDASVVLIENQLEQIDHKHLGQIMTYLAGLDAKTVIWIAPRFRAPHLTAIHWLNENTADSFSFFAVRARVVRIGDSPYAPIFDVVARPDKWDRALQSVRKQNKTTEHQFDDLLAVWTLLFERAPELEERGLRPYRWFTQWLEQLALPGIFLCLHVGKDRSGVYLRGDRGTTAEETFALLAPHARALEAQLGAEITPSASGHFCENYIPYGFLDAAHHLEIVDMLARRYVEYETALKRCAAPPCRPGFSPARGA